MKKHGSIVAVAVTLAIGLAVPTAAAPPPTVTLLGPHRLVIAVDAHFANASGVAVGRFVAAGAVTDRGGYTDNGGRTSPPNGPPRILDELATFRGSKGTFTAKIHVQLQLLALAVATNSGTVTIVKGTGAYARLVGSVSTRNIAVVSNSLAERPPGAPPELPLPSQNFVKVVAIFKVQ